MKLFNSLLSIFILITFMACKGEVTKSQNINESNNQFTGEIKETVELSDNLLRDLSEDIIFSGTSDVQRSSFQADVLKIKTRLIQLNSDPNNVAALKDLNARIKRIEDAPILDRDYYFINPFLVKVKEIALDIARLQGSAAPPAPPTILAYDYSFAERNLDGFTEIKEGESPSGFNMVTRNGFTYAEANSFKDKNNGAVFLVSESIELLDKNYSVQVNQSINFYNDPAKEKKYIRIMVGIDNADISLIEWKELKFETVPAGNAWPSVLSEWLKIEQKESNIRLAFRYESGNGLSEYPNWQLYSVQVKEND